MDLAGGVAKIDDVTEDPMQLFNTWFQQVKSCGHLQPDALSLSTSTKDGKVSSRHLLLRRIDSDGFVIVTDRRSKKSKELLENPIAAVAFLWTYMDDGKRISRQVRLEGTVVELKPEDYEEIYNQEPLYCKLRSYVCHQGQPTTWEQQKEKFDRYSEEFTDGKNLLPMPEHYIGYKIIPNMFDFYHAYDTFFADRVCFLKEDDHWKNFKIEA